MTSATGRGRLLAIDYGERRIGLAQNHSLLMDETDGRFCEAVSGQPLCARTFDWNTEVARINNAAGNFAIPPAPMPLQPGSAASAATLKEVFQSNLWPGRTYSAVDQTVKPHPYTQQSVDMTFRGGNTSVYASGSFVEEGGAIRFLDGYRRMEIKEMFGVLTPEQQVEVRKKALARRNALIEEQKQLKQEQPKRQQQKPPLPPQ